MNITPTKEDRKITKFSEEIPANYDQLHPKPELKVGDAQEKVKPLLTAKYTHKNQEDKGTIFKPKNPLNTVVSQVINTSNNEHHESTDHTLNENDEDEPTSDLKKGKDNEPPKSLKEEISFYFKNLLPTWKMILLAILPSGNLDYFSQLPSIMCVLCVYVIYFFGTYVNIGAFVVFVICVVNVVNRIIRIKKREVSLQDRKIRNQTHNKFGELRETANWLNRYLELTYGNHNRYISYLFVRFANPLLSKLCKPHPLEHLAFVRLDVGPAAPKLNNIQVKFSDHEMIFDFDVHYKSSFRGQLEAKLVHAPLVPVLIQQLTFRARMGFIVVFEKDKFPFISSLKWQLVTRPEIEINVQAPVLPAHIVDNHITERFVDMVAEEMCNHILRPKFVEGTFHDFVQDDQTADIFMSAIETLIKEMIEHTTLSRDAPLPDEDAIRGIGVSWAVVKQMKTHFSRDETKKKRKSKGLKGYSEFHLPNLSFFTYDSPEDDRNIDSSDRYYVQTSNLNPTSKNPNSKLSAAYSRTVNAKSGSDNSHPPHSSGSSNNNDNHKDKGRAKDVKWADISSSPSTPNITLKGLLNTHHHTTSDQSGSNNNNNNNNEHPQSSSSEGGGKVGAARSVTTNNLSIGGNKSTPIPNEFRGNMPPPMWRPFVRRSSSLTDINELQRKGLTVDDEDDINTPADDLQTRPMAHSDVIPPTETKASKLKRLKGIITRKDTPK